MSCFAPISAITRLQAARHNDALRCPQRAERHGHRAEHAAPPPSGVHPLPQPHRARGAGRQAIHVILDNFAAHKKTRSAPGSTATRAGPSISPSILLLAQRRRGLLRQTHPAQAQARRLPFRCRSSGRHQPLHPRIQCREPATIHLESQPR